MEQPRGEHGEAVEHPSGGSLVEHPSGGAWWSIPVGKHSGVPVVRVVEFPILAY